jgi:hypothetical protein
MALKVAVAASFISSVEFCKSIAICCTSCTDLTKMGQWVTKPANPRHIRKLALVHMAVGASAVVTAVSESDFPFIKHPCL